MAANGPTILSAAVALASAIQEIRGKDQGFDSSSKDNGGVDDSERIAVGARAAWIKRVGIDFNPRRNTGLDIDSVTACIHIFRLTPTY